MDKQEELPEEVEARPGDDGDGSESGAVPAAASRTRGGPAPDPGDDQPKPASLADTLLSADGSEQESGAPTDSLSQFLKRTIATLDEPEDSADQPILPKQPRTLADVGLSRAFLTDLTLKIIHYSGAPSLAQLTRRLGLGTHIVQLLLSALTEERLIEVLSQSDLYTGNYRYRLSERGAQRVAEALDRSRYAGPAPVTAEQYSEVMRRLQTHKQEFTRARIKNILHELVLGPEVADSVARALYAAKAAIFYGPSGNGKTSILDRFASDVEGVSLIPYAIYAYGQVIRVFDQSIHEPLEELDSANMVKDDTKIDRRWVLVKRPAIVLGAEIGQESLDLTYDPQSRFYQAPPHIKAQGGVLVVDDFGRQKIAAKELLTRWMIPLERGWDTLSLVTGEKLTVPFSLQLLFGTNISIRKLADDALLRRILYKVEIPSPQADEFTEIMRRTCRNKRVLVDDGALDYVVKRLYSEPDLQPRASYGRDLLDMLIESASFDGRDPVLDKDSFDRVFRLFMAKESDGPGDSDD